MQVVLSRNLADCFHLLDRFQGDLEFEVVTVLLPFFRQFYPPQAVIIILQSILACGPVFGGKYSDLWLGTHAGRESIHITGHRPSDFEGSRG